MGAVKTFKSPNHVKDKSGKEYVLFKFTLACKDVDVPIVAWDDDVKRIIDEIKINNVSSKVNFNFCIIFIIMNGKFIFIIIDYSH